MILNVISQKHVDSHNENKTSCGRDVFVKWDVLFPNETKQYFCTMLNHFVVNGYDVDGIKSWSKRNLLNQLKQDKDDRSWEAVLRGVVFCRAVGWKEQEFKLKNVKISSKDGMI